MPHQLWNLATGNAIAEYETEAEALALVRETVQEHGRHEAMAWALTADDEHTVTEPIAEGEALIDRAFRVPA
jgi:hypothetical protein